jgi:hypothetical protein
LYKKQISILLVVALLNLVGCYSFESVTVPEYKQFVEEEGKPDEIYVKTKDIQEYYFSESNFNVENDTLYGTGKLLRSTEAITFEERISISEIDSIELYYFGQKYPTLVTVSQYQKIEAESGKADEIYLTKNDSTKYHFMKNDYYIENDTLYGKGKFLPIEKDQPFEGSIAFTEVESIRVETYDRWMTVLLSTPIAMIAVIGIAFLLVGKPGAQSK